MRTSTVPSRRRRLVIASMVVIVLIIGGGGLWFRSSRSWSQTIPYAAPAGEQTGPVPAPNASWHKDGGTFVDYLELSGGRTGFNDRELVLGSAGPPPREASPESGCGQDIQVAIVEDTPERVVLQARAYAGRNERQGLLDRTEIMCTAMRHGRTTTVQLPSPLAGRPVFANGPGGPLSIIDGSTLLVPSWLPEGYHLMGETAGTFTYSTEPVVGPSHEGGTAVGGLSISQGPHYALIPSGTTGDRSPEEVTALLGRLMQSGQAMTVRGQPGVIIRSSPVLPDQLTWHEGSDWLTISFQGPVSGGALPPTNAELLAVAESLHTTKR